MRIKYLADSAREFECYKDGKWGIHKIDKGDVFEVRSDNFINSFPLDVLKQTDKPKPRYYNEWVLRFGSAILGYIGGFLTQ